MRMETIVMPPYTPSRASSVRRQIGSDATHVSTTVVFGGKQLDLREDVERHDKLYYGHAQLQLIQ